MSLEGAPQVQGVRATAENWQDPPFNRWAYWHDPRHPAHLAACRAGRAIRALPASAAPRDLPASA